MHETTQADAEKSVEELIFHGRADLDVLRLKKVLDFCVQSVIMITVRKERSDVDETRKRKLCPL